MRRDRFLKNTKKERTRETNRKTKTGQKSHITDVHTNFYVYVHTLTHTLSFVSVLFSSFHLRSQVDWECVVRRYSLSLIRSEVKIAAPAFVSKLSLFFTRTSCFSFIIFFSVPTCVWVLYILTMCRLFNAEFSKSAFSRPIYWVCWVIEIDRRRFIQQFVDIITQFFGCLFLTNFCCKVQI